RERVPERGPERRRMVVCDPARPLHHAPRPRGLDARLPVRGAHQPPAAGGRVSALLEVSDLRVDYRGQPIVDGVDFALRPGEALGLAGESGCGKTTTALALMKLLPSTLKQSGTVTL